MVVSATSARSQRQYRYELERSRERPGFVDVALVRRQARQGKVRRLRRHERDDGLVLFHRAFRPLAELFPLETYSGHLARVVQHANDGTFGCFVVIDTSVGMLDIRLYERWFDGQRLQVDELAKRVFDPSDDETLVSGAEFVAELEDFAVRGPPKRVSVQSPCGWGLLDELGDGVAAALGGEELVEVFEQ